MTVLIIGAIAGLAFIGGPGQSDLRSSAAPVNGVIRSDKLGVGPVGRVVISPNGEYVAYSTETGGKESLWLRRLATSENIQIVPPANETYLGLTISNDGNSLYFVRRSMDERQASAIYRVMTFGGIAVKIADQSDGSISVSPDDKKLLFTRCQYTDEAFCSLMLIDVDGGNERALLTRERPTRLLGAEFSPDGKSIAFASGQSWSGGSDFRLMLLDPASGIERQISPKTFFIINQLRWLPDGRGLLLTAREHLDGTSRIWQVASQTGDTREVTKDATDFLSISMDKSAGKVIATRSSDTFQLYFAGINDLKNARSLGAARKGLSFAPDGRIIHEGSDGDIWTINHEGSGRRQLTNSSYQDFFPCHSPSGRHVFFTSNRSGSNQIWRMNTDGGEVIQITKNVGGYPKRVTPDGKWLYYESGIQRNVWRVSTDGGEEYQLSKMETPSSQVSPDGRYIGYLSHASGGERRTNVALMSTERGDIVKTLGRHDSRLTAFGWSQDGAGLYYVSAGASGNSLWYQPLSAASPRLIGDLGPNEIVDFELSPNGQGLAFIRGRWVHDAVLIEGLSFFADSE